MSQIKKVRDDTIHIENDYLCVRPCASPEFP